MDKREKVLEICEYFKFEIILVVISTIYLFLLNNLNNILLAKYAQNEYLDVLAYDDFKPCYYFVIAFILGILAAIIFFDRLKQIRYFDLDFWGMIFNFISMFVMFMLVVFIIYFISIPILKAILAVCASAIGFLKKQ